MDVSVCMHASKSIDAVMRLLTLCVCVYMGVFNTVVFYFHAYVSIIAV